MFALEINTDKIPNETAKYAVDQYLAAGDWILAQGSGLMARYPDYFTNASKDSK